MASFWFIIKCNHYNYREDLMPRQKLYPDEETVALSIRIPASMKEEIEERAVKNRRSQNQEVVWLIQKGLETLAKDQASEA
jgi:hypothetical protein